MTDMTLSSMYSAEGLKALKQSLELHQGLVWQDPATQTIAVKSITSVKDAVPITPQESSDSVIT